ncbi:MAG: RIP metalloprotease RseP [Bdellovibrionales bacterium]|nr:RIP metalloprotease RseP [Bdellovibrionales bacterium]
MLNVIGFLAILGPLVIFHEFGHYLFARLFKVKAEAFSIGFGPILWSKQIGETNWRVSAIPLGGYVKLLGDSPDVKLTESEKKRALPNQVAWKRFFIFFGGPLFNFILASFIYMLILLIGEQHLTSRVGRVVRGSYAEKVGFQSGDKIQKVNGKEVRKFEEVLVALNENPGREVVFSLDRAGRPLELKATPTSQEGYSIYGENIQVGEIEGLLGNARTAQIGVSNPGSVAGLAGLKTGETIAKWNGQAVSTWEEIEVLGSSLKGGQTLNLTVTGEKGASREVSLKVPGDLKKGFENALGLFSSEMFIEKTVPKSPAETAGIQAMDRLVAIASTEVNSFFSLKDAVQKSGEKAGKIHVKWERQGKMMEADLVPTETKTKDPMMKKHVQYTIGVMPMLVWTEPETITERILNPFVLLYRGTERMIIFSYRNLVTIGKLFTGDVSIKTLGGPILIGKIAGESISRGLTAFLNTMALLSIGLGVLNLLPVPVLDGGHLVLLTLEVIRGKALTIRQMEIIQQVGLSLILLLMVIVFSNDVARILPVFN